MATMTSPLHEFMNNLIRLDRNHRGQPLEMLVLVDDNAKLPETSYTRMMADSNLNNLIGSTHSNKGKHHHGRWDNASASSMFTAAHTRRGRQDSQLPDFPVSPREASLSPCELPSRRSCRWEADSPPPPPSLYALSPISYASRWGNDANNRSSFSSLHSPMLPARKGFSAAVVHVSAELAGVTKQHQRRLNRSHMPSALRSLPY